MSWAPGGEGCAALLALAGGSGDDMPSSVVRLSGVKPPDIRYRADVQGKSVCQNPNIE